MSYRFTNNTMLKAVFCFSSRIAINKLKSSERVKNNFILNGNHFDRMRMQLTETLGGRGAIRRGRIMRRTMFHTNWKPIGSFHCCCHFVFLFRNYIAYRERLDLKPVFCLVHLKVSRLFLIISPINLFEDKFFSLYFAIM